MSRNLNIGILILRVSIGLMLLLHGFAKISNGFAGIKGMLAGMGLPEFLAYGALVGEVVAPLLLIVGLLTRPAAAVIAFNMLVAVAMAHCGDVLLFFFPAVALVFTGGGKYIIASRTCLD